MIVAADHSAFFLPEAFVGVIPDAGTVRLPKILPPAIAREILMTGRRMSAAEAAQWGIVNAVVPADQVMDKARELASSVVSAAPLAIGAIKELMRGTDALSLEAGFEFMRSGGAPLYKRMLESEDAQEGPKAFSEKREPVWKGR